MLIVVTVNAQQFPIAAIARIVVVIVVPVVHREQMQIRTGEFARAPPADPGVNLERLFAIRILPELAVAPGLGYDPIQPVVAWLRWFRRHVRSAAERRISPTSVKIDRVFLEFRERNVFEHGFVSCGQHDPRRGAGIQCFHPARGAQAPLVTGL